MNIDLHFHSRYSDGQFWPVDLAKRLGKAGVTIAALTDHDTFAGVPAFLDAAEREGIKGVAATEIDFCDPDFGFKSELLGYFPAGSYARTEAHAAGLRLTFGSDFHGDTSHGYPSLGGDSNGFAKEARSFVFADR
jgi:hypothetical protein